MRITKSDGKWRYRNSLSRFDPLRRANVKHVSGDGKADGPFADPQPMLSKHSYGCHLVDVTWQREMALLRVSRVVTVIDAGQILNPLAGRNQIEGAAVMGIEMALFEATHYDPRNGAPINSNLADYLIAVRVRKLPITIEELLTSTFPG